MPNRPLKPSSILTLILPVVMMIVLMTGCGSDRTSITGSGDVGGSEFSYPAISQNQLEDGPVPGFRFFMGASRGREATLDDLHCDSLSASRLCSPWSSRTVGHYSLVTVRITPGDMPANETITVVAPLGNCAAVADFYPHPYQFNGTVEISWFLNGFELPPDFDYDSLIPFYVNDNGDYEEMPFTWYGNHDVLVVSTNHFSRYIIGQKDVEEDPGSGGE